MTATVFERSAPAASLVEDSLAGCRSRVFWTDDLPADLRPDRPPLTTDHVCDLVIVGAGYTGLWTALLAKDRDPSRRVVVVEANRVGWAASSRNGGFCEASLTHGEENGRRRWPDEMPDLDRLGRANLDAIGAAEAEYGMDFQFERTGSFIPATEPHQVDWLREMVAGHAARDAGDGAAGIAGADGEGDGDGDGGVSYLDRAAAQAVVASPSYLAAVLERDTSALVHPARLAAELARVAEARGVQIFERTRGSALATDAGGGGVTVETPGGRLRTAEVVLATNVFPSLLKRNRLMTVPVYDYVLMTEPLTSEQRRSIGWEGRQGIGDMANQFHYYRLTRDDRILFGGYDAIYHYGARVDPAHEDRPTSYRRLASHFFTTFPQLEGLRFSHRWAGAIDTSTQFAAFYGLARRGRVAYAAGFTGLGVGSTRFAAEVVLDLLAGVSTERTRLEMVRRRPLPFPPEPAAALGINATRWSLDRADHREGRRNLLLKALDAAGLGFDS